MHEGYTLIIFYEETGLPPYIYIYIYIYILYYSVWYQDAKDFDESVLCGHFDSLKTQESSMDYVILNCDTFVSRFKSILGWMNPRMDLSLASLPQISWRSLSAGLAGFFVVCVICRCIRTLWFCVYPHGFVRMMTLLKLHTAWIHICEKSYTHAKYTIVRIVFPNPDIGVYIWRERCMVMRASLIIYIYIYIHVYTYIK